MPTRISALIQTSNCFQQAAMLDTEAGELKK